MRHTYDLIGLICVIKVLFHFEVERLLVVGTNLLAVKWHLLATDMRIQAAKRSSCCEHAFTGRERRFYWPRRKSEPRRYLL